MQKAALVQKIRAIRDEMAPLAVKWAKVRQKKFDERFEHLDDMTLKDLEGHYIRIKAIHTGTWAHVKEVWGRLPEAQWETTFLLGMRHLPEYADLSHALSEFRNNFMGNKKPVKERGPERRGRPKKDVQNQAGKTGS